MFSHFIRPLFQHGGPLLLLLLLTACQPLTIPATVATAIADEIAVQQAQSADASDQSDADTDPTSTPVPATEPEDVAEVMPTDPPAEEAPAEPAVIVRASSLNLRQGPGTDYPILGAAKEGDTFPLRGQAFDCSWVTAEHPTLGSIWLSGNAQYTTLTVDCAAVALAESPPRPTPLPAPTVAPAAEQPVAPTVAPVPAEDAPSASQPPGGDPFPADKGCFLFQNQLGPELTITINAKDGTFSDTFWVQQGNDLPYCLWPGRYTITVDAPPPWADLNDEFSIAAGDRILFPVRPQK